MSHLERLAHLFPLTDKARMIRTIVFSATSWCEYGSFCGRDSMIVSLLLKEFTKLKAFRFVIDEEYVPGNWSPAFERAYMVHSGRQLPQPGRMSDQELKSCESLIENEMWHLRSDLLFYYTVDVRVLQPLCYQPDMKVSKPPVCCLIRRAL